MKSLIHKDLQNKDRAQNSVVILGVDPGSRVCGYALISATGRSFSMLDSGVCDIKGVSCFFTRLSRLSEFFNQLAKDIGPFDLAIESLAYVKNANSFGKLAQARGAIIAALMPHANGVFEYPPNLIKSTVSGYGHASKKGIQKALNLTTNQGHQFATDDESDALAVCLCHHFRKDAI